MHPRRFWVLYIEGKGATIEPTVRPAPRCASDSSSMRKVGASFHVHSQWHGSFLTAINPYISPLRQICLKHRTEITVCRSVQMQLNGVLLTQTIGSRASLLLWFQTAVDFDQIKRLCFEHPAINQASLDSGDGATGGIGSILDVKRFAVQSKLKNPCHLNTKTLV